VSQYEHCSDIQATLDARAQGTSEDFKLCGILT